MKIHLLYAKSIIICGTLILSVPFPLVAQAQLLDFPSENSNADIGKGYDSLNAVARQKCIEYKDTPGELSERKGDPQSGHLTLTHTTSSEEFASEFAFSAAASFSYGVYSGDLSVKYSHSEKLNQYSEYLLVSTQVENARQILKSVVLTDLAKKAAKKGEVAFFQACGDQFIEGYVTGGEFTAVVNASSSSKEEQTDTSATMHAAASGSGSLDASVKEKLTSLQKNGKLTVEVTRKGPADPYPPLTVPELIDYAVQYPKLVSSKSGNAWTTRYLTSEYTGLVDFPAYDPLQNRIMNKLALYVRSLYYRRAGLTYIKKNPSQFAAFDGTRLNAELQSLSDKIAEVTTSASECVINSKKCKDPGDISVGSLPDLKSLPILVDPAINAWKYVGSSVGSEIKIVSVEGSWNNYCVDNQPRGQTIPSGASDILRFLNRKTAAESFTNAGKPNRVPQDSDVFYKVADSYYLDNCPHDGLKVYMYTPVYPEDYKLPETTSLTEAKKKAEAFLRQENVNKQLEPGGEPVVLPNEIKIPPPLKK